MTSRLRQFLNILIQFALALACVTAAFSAPGLALAQEKSFTWDRLDVDIQVNKDGTFRVCETNDITLDNGAFTNGYRNIPLSRVTDLTDFSVTDGNGHTYTPGSEPYQFTVEQQGNEKVINWYFPPMSGGKSETYTLCYTVHGGLWWYDQKEAGDQLVWKALYQDRPFSVQASRVTVSLPPGADVMEKIAFIDAKAAGNRVKISQTSGPDGAVVTYELSGAPIAGGHEMEVALQFPHGVVNFAKAPWQAAEDARLLVQAKATATAQAVTATGTTTASPGVLVPGLAMAKPASPPTGVALASSGGGGSGGAGGLWVTVLLMLAFTSSLAVILVYWYKRIRKPPLAPVAEYLTEPPADLKPYHAGLMIDQKLNGNDLLSIIVDLAQRGVLSLTGSTEGKGEITVRREGKSSAVDEVEQLVLDKFVHKESYTLPELAESLRKQGRTLVRAIDDELSGMGVVAEVASKGHWLTDYGRHRLDECQAFGRYLRNVQQYAEFDSQKEIWDRYLPWAIALGVSDQYVNAAIGKGVVSPLWFFESESDYEERRPQLGRFFNLPGMGSGSSGASTLSMPSGPSGPSGLGGASLPNVDLGRMSRSLGGGLDNTSKQMANSLNIAAASMLPQPVSLDDAGLLNAAATGAAKGGGARGGSAMGDIDAGDVAAVALKVGLVILQIALGGKGGSGGGGGGGGFR